jgi:hypothetical protein
MFSWGERKTTQSYPEGAFCERGFEYEEEIKELPLMRSSIIPVEFSSYLTNSLSMCIRI